VIGAGSLPEVQRMREYESEGYFDSIIEIGTDTDRRTEVSCVNREMLAAAWTLTIDTDDSLPPGDQRRTASSRQKGGRMPWW